MTTTSTDAPRHERANLWVICAAQFLTLGGMTAVLPLIPLYLQQIGVTDRATLKYWTGAIGSAPFAVAVFFTPVWGALADRVGYKPMVVRSVFGIALATFGMGFSTTPVTLLLWRGVQGAVAPLFEAAEIVPRDGGQWHWCLLQNAAELLARRGSADVAALLLGFAD